MIIKLAKELQTQVVAEGVESMEQLTFLKREACNQIQGYLFSPPVSVKKLETFLNKKMNSVEEEANLDDHRVHFPYPLEAQMELLSIGNQEMKLELHIK